MDQQVLNHWADQVAALRARAAAAAHADAQGEQAGAHEHHAEGAAAGRVRHHAAHESDDGTRILPEIVLVSSGAIAEGMKRLGWKKRPREVRQLQAAAAIGQMGIAQAYENAFQRHGIETAQVLLTHEDGLIQALHLHGEVTSNIKEVVHCWTSHTDLLYLLLNSKMTELCLKTIFSFAS